MPDRLDQRAALLEKRRDLPGPNGERWIGRFMTDAWPSFFSNRLFKSIGHD